MLYRYAITPESPFRTPLMSDTFFGHFCWAVLYREGEAFLEDFLKSYDNDGPGPVLFSSGFLSGRLPRPSLPSPPRGRLLEFVHAQYGTGKKAEFDGINDIKKWSKRRFIAIDQWQALKSGYSDLGLYAAFFKDRDVPETESAEAEVAASNAINRITGTVQAGGGLFYRAKLWYRPGAVLDLYVEVNAPEMKPLVDWFLTEHLPVNGFGADKSTGMGGLKISPDDGFDPAAFDVPGAGARLSLSLAAFPGMGEIDASYRLMTKFGKLGGTFAFASPTGGDPRPFKKPVLMYAPGAVFFCETALNDRRLLDGVHTDARIRHCGVPVTLPFKLTEDS